MFSSDDLSTVGLGGRLIDLALAVLSAIALGLLDLDLLRRGLLLLLLLLLRLLAP